jgi:hypothetical protein
LLRAFDSVQWLKVCRSSSGSSSASTPASRNNRRNRRCCGSRRTRQTLTDSPRRWPTRSKPIGGWYADFHSDAEATVVFAGRIFRYRRGDDTEHVKVADDARSVGVPKEQLD